METAQPRPMPVHRTLTEAEMTPKQIRARQHRHDNPQIYRDSARKHYHNNIDKIRRRNALTRANAHGSVPRQSTIERYNLIWDATAGVWI